MKKLVDLSHHSCFPEFPTELSPDVSLLLDNRIGSLERIGGMLLRWTEGDESLWT